MSATDYAHSVDLSGSARLVARMPVDLTVPSAFYSLPLSSNDNVPTPSSSIRTGLPHGIPQPSLSLIQSSAAQTRLAPPPYGQEFFFHNKDFVRFHSTSPTSPISPSQPQPSSSTPTHPFGLNNSFPPSTYNHRHFHQINFPSGEPGSPSSSNPTSTPEYDLDRTASPEVVLSPKAPTERSPDLRNSSKRERFERFPPAKRFIRSLASSPLEEISSVNEKGFLDNSDVKSVRSDNGDENSIGDENKSEVNHEVDYSFPSKATVSTSHQSHYISQFSCSLSSSSPGTFNSSLFPVSFLSPQLLKPHPVTPSTFMKRRHSANNPIVVDSNIPFTTYLHNLTLTLQQSAARAKSTSTYSGLVCKEELESLRQVIETPDTTSEIGTKDAHNGSKRLGDSSEETNANDAIKTEAGGEDQDDCVNSDEEEIRVQSSDEQYTNKAHEKRKRKLYPSGRSMSEFHGIETKFKFNNLKSGGERSPITHHSTVPILSSMAYPVSPESHVISSSHLHSPHLHPQQQQLKQPQPLNVQQNMQALTLTSMRSSRSPRVPHPHLSSAAQFPSLYSKLFPQFAPSPNPSHLNFTNPILSGPGPALGGLSSTPNRLNSLFHPSFLGLGNMGMRRTSAEKPPPVKKYKCDVCQKAFSRSNTLVTHKRIHTGDKPFKCEICGRAFRQPGNLTRHRLTHTTHKPYVCHVCNKAFNRASNLNTHIRTHSSFRHFGCTGCPKNFHFKPDLASHIYSPNGERPFKCDICGRGFAHSSTLATHQRTHNATDAPPKATVDSQASIFV